MPKSSTGPNGSPSESFGCAPSATAAVEYAEVPRAVRMPRHPANDEGCNPTTGGCAWPVPGGLGHARVTPMIGGSE